MQVLRIHIPFISALLFSVITFAEAQVVQTPVMPLFKADTVTICIMGDMMMHTKQIDIAKQPDGSFDFTSYFSHIKDKISSADIAIANMEFTLGGEPFTGYPAFSAPDSYATYLAECGFDIFLAANNHIFDKGGAGAERTLGIYRELGKKYGIKVCGLAENEVVRSETTPLEILIKGIKIGFVNFTYGTNLGTDRHWPKTNYMSDRSLIKKALTEAEDCDITIALPHWGTEYELTHSAEQEATAALLAEYGADVIVGTHPHVPQDSGKVSDRNVPVAYSLGNGVSNMSAPNTQIELMAEIRVVRETDGDIIMLPIRFTYLWCSRPGGLDKSFTVIPIKEFIDKKGLWKGTWDYDKMVSTYERVRNITGIE